MKNKVLGMTVLGVILFSASFASAADYKVVWSNQLRSSTDSYFTVTVKHLPVPGMEDVTARDSTTRLAYGGTLDMTVSAPTCAGIELHVTRTRIFIRDGRSSTESIPLSGTVPCAATVTATITGSGITIN